MMLGRGLIIALALGAACAAGMVDSASPARAQSGGLRSDTPPAMRRLLTDPAVRPAIALIGQGDFAGGAALLKEGARRGSPSAQVMLAQLYLAGKGVPQDNLQAMIWLGVVIKKHKEPSFSVAAATLQSLQASRTTAQASGAQDERMKDPEFRRGVQELVQQWQQWRRAGSPSGFVTCYGMVCM